MTTVHSEPETVTLMGAAPAPEDLLHHRGVLIVPTIDEDDVELDTRVVPLEVPDAAYPALIAGRANCRDRSIGWWRVTGQWNGEAFVAKEIREELDEALDDSRLLWVRDDHRQQSMQPTSGPHLVVQSQSGAAETELLPTMLEGQLQDGGRATFGFEREGVWRYTEHDPEGRVVTDLHLPEGYEVSNLLTTRLTEAEVRRLSATMWAMDNGVDPGNAVALAEFFAAEEAYIERSRRAAELDVPDTPDAPSADDLKPLEEVNSDAPWPSKLLVLDGEGPSLAEAQRGAFFLTLSPTDNHIDPYADPADWPADPEPPWAHDPEWAGPGPSQSARFRVLLPDEVHTAVAAHIEAIGEQQPYHNWWQVAGTPLEDEPYTLQADEVMHFQQWLSPPAFVWQSDAARELDAMAGEKRWEVLSVEMAQLGLDPADPDAVAAYVEWCETDQAQPAGASSFARSSAHARMMEHAHSSPTTHEQQAEDEAFDSSEPSPADQADQEWLAWLREVAETNAAEVAAAMTALGLDPGKPADVAAYQAQMEYDDELEDDELQGDSPGSARRPTLVHISAPAQLSPEQRLVNAEWDSGVSAAPRAQRTQPQRQHTIEME